MTVRLARRVLAGLCLMLLTSAGASAQVFGTFSWAMQPYCNVVTLTITQIPGGFTINGNDNQCGAAKLAGAAGMALINPDGTVGLEFTIVTAPSAKAAHVSASLNPATGSGPWSDNFGNNGTFALGVAGGGSPRPLPASGILPGTITSTELAAGAVGTANLAIGAVTGPNIAAGAVGSANIAAGAVGSAQLALGAVGSTNLAGGAVGAAAINAAQVQARVTGTCPAGQAIRVVNANGTVSCGAAPVELLAALVNADATLGGSSGATGAFLIGTGLYEITFNRDVSSCFYSASPHTFGISLQQVQPRIGNSNGVFLRTNDSVGNPANGAFYLTVFCPRP